MLVAGTAGKPIEAPGGGAADAVDGIAGVIGESESGGAQSSVAETSNCGLAGSKNGRLRGLSRPCASGGAEVAAVDDDDAGADAPADAVVEDAPTRFVPPMPETGVCDDDAGEVGGRHGVFIDRNSGASGAPARSIRRPPLSLSSFSLSAPFSFLLALPAGSGANASPLTYARNLHARDHTRDRPQVVRWHRRTAQSSRVTRRSVT